MCCFSCNINVFYELIELARWRHAINRITLGSGNHASHAVVLCQSEKNYISMFAVLCSLHNNQNRISVIIEISFNTQKIYDLCETNSAAAANLQLFHCLHSASVLDVQIYILWLNPAVHRLAVGLTIFIGALSGHNEGNRANISVIIKMASFYTIN